jgi:hypothetical protein
VKFDAKRWSSIVTVRSHDHRRARNVPIAQAARQRNLTVLLDGDGATSIAGPDVLS